MSIIHILCSCSELFSINYWHTEKIQESLK